MALQRWGPRGLWGPATLQRRRSWGPTTLQRQGSWALRPSRGVGPGVPRLSRGVGPGGPGVPVCTGVRMVCLAPCFQLPQGPLLCWWEG